MSRVLKCLAVVFLLCAASLAFAAEGGDSCRGGQCQPRGPVVMDGWLKPGPQPTLAWRYDHPTLHRRGVVRVYAELDGRTRQIGSGVIIVWNRRLVVLTARHVVSGAKDIRIWTHRGATYSVRPLNVDATWDCAVLEVPAESVNAVKELAVDIAFGDEAMDLKSGQLESCGYGPDGKLAVNIGNFQRYTRSTHQRSDGPDDWFVIAGHARQGDSGGPVFNKAGKVVGVLWGTDGQTVVCVQAGRLHVLLDAAIPAKQTGFPQTGFPTRPMPAPPTQVTPPSILPQPVDPIDALRSDYWLPFRRDMAESSASLNRKLDELDRRLGEINANLNRPQLQIPGLPGVTLPLPAMPKPDADADKAQDEKIKNKLNPIESKVDGLLKKIEEHGGPIGSRLAGKLSDNIEGGDPLVRIASTTSGIIFLTVAACLIFFGVHFCVKRIHEKLDKLGPRIEALKEARPELAPFLEKLQSVHEKIGGMNDAVQSKFDGLRGHISEKIANRAPVSLPVSLPSLPLGQMAAGALGGAPLGPVGAAVGAAAPLVAGVIRSATSGQ
jgi:hypothetical protein